MHIPTKPTPQVDAEQRPVADWLDEADLDWIARASLAPNPDNLPEIRVWPRGYQNHFGQEELVGRCPLCGFLHEHGLGASFYRLPACSNQLPPFVNGAEKPLQYQIRPEATVMPDDIRFELSTAHKRVDLLAQTARALRQPYSTFMTQLRQSGHQAKMRIGRKPWTKAQFEVTFASLISSGVVDERAAMMADGGCSSQEQATRKVLAAYIRGFKRPASKGGNRMSRRIGLACFDAERRAARGDC